MRDLANHLIRTVETKKTDRLGMQPDEKKQMSEWIDLQTKTKKHRLPSTTYRTPGYDTNFILHMIQQAETGDTTRVF
jgi:hypothetical protein